MKTSTETRITKAEAIGTLEVMPVFARLSDGSETQVGAIAWTTWRSFDALSTHSVDDTQYFFTKN